MKQNELNQKYTAVLGAFRAVDDAVADLIGCMPLEPGQGNDKKQEPKRQITASMMKNLGVFQLHFDDARARIGLVMSEMLCYTDEANEELAKIRVERAAAAETEKSDGETGDGGEEK